MLERCSWIGSWWGAPFVWGALVATEQLHFRNEGGGGGVKRHGLLSPQQTRLPSRHNPSNSNNLRFPSGGKAPDIALGLSCPSSPFHLFVCPNIDASKLSAWRCDRSALLTLYPPSPQPPFPSFSTGSWWMGRSGISPEGPFAFLPRCHATSGATPTHPTRPVVCSWVTSAWKFEAGLGARTAMIRLHESPSKELLDLAVQAVAVAPCGLQCPRAATPVRLALRSAPQGHMAISQRFEPTK